MHSLAWVNDFFCTKQHLSAIHLDNHWMNESDPHSDILWQLLKIDLQMIYRIVLNLAQIIVAILIHRITTLLLNKIRNIDVMDKN